MCKNEKERAIGPPYFGYRFKITSTRNNSILGTGFFKSDEELTKEEQIDFLHQYTSGIFLDTGYSLNIDIFEANA